MLKSVRFAKDGQAAEIWRDMAEKRFVYLNEVADRVGLENLTPEIDLSAIKVDHRSVNRPAFQLTGFYEYFDAGRLQVFGKAEYEYIKALDKETYKERMDRLFSLGFPAAIYARGLMPDETAMQAAEKYNIPILASKYTTAKIIVDIIEWINEKLAPTTTVHGVLVDVYGEGILITGDSGIGKSETAIELVKRGHRLVADDLIEISRLRDGVLVGKAPDLTRYFAELRGIGAIDVKSLFGVESIKLDSPIDMIVHLKEWDGKTSYDRLGLNENFEKILGESVIRYDIPVRPGRNLAIIIESAAVNVRQKKMGYNAAQELVDRVSEEIKRKKDNA